MESTTLKYVWLDCDPGHDDAFAIMMAGHSKSLKLLGISTVVGNQTVEKTTINALKVCAISGLSDVEVVKGAANPLMRPSMVCPEIHGDSGLDSSVVWSVDTKSPLEKNAIVHMYDTIRSTFLETGKLTTIIATAALTNVALLFSVFPDVKSMVESVTLLGGAMTVGNMTPVAEFNILVDPEAAKIVYDSGVKIFMVPLEVSHKALITKQILERIQSLDNSYFITLSIELLKFFTQQYMNLFGMESPPLHDPLAVAAVINPSMFTTRLLRVDIECKSDLCAGQTVCDVWNFSNKPKNVHVATDVDLPAFYDMLIDSIDKSNKQSCLNKK
ncbi:N-D-ribosylpurine ribohydrolase [Heterostelium album PN500]|uniref:N-D-ribosylpurine ribohydrolase n=1 Tax=Heterostelium pallidum (strain ATCC 26659 / Pp 5 / PN500) TaxID=670386 RepID=D3B2U1_HETP5|nr:N-D-ribosylpurine ribohydrolase [Heterostelium album PN500]EFA83639.1 N-D-ribosylpurine ribohydrolase [Heterostelium album PN500]|eukprot:XP_020435756.1 N-D-ribosylpurine ribohydrolase [Heterostelium album PN500]